MRWSSLPMRRSGAISERWSFAALEDAVQRTGAGLLDAGFSPGERLLIRLDNTSTFPILFLGAIAAGLVAMPASSQLTPDEAAFLLADSEAPRRRTCPAPAARRDPRWRARAHGRRGARLDGTSAAYRLCGYTRRRSRLSALHVRHHRAPQRRPARPPRRSRTLAHVSGLVRDDRERPHAARGRLQLDVHARHRAHRPVGERRDGAHLRGREDARDLAAADPRHGRHAVCRRAEPDASDPEVCAARAHRSRALRHAHDRRRKAARGSVRGLARTHRTGVVRGARHERDLHLHLDRPRRAAQAGNRRQAAAGRRIAILPPTAAKIPCPLAKKG